jgi:hypothetical protein
MLINTSLSTEAAARDLQKSRGADVSSTAAGDAAKTADSAPGCSADATYEPQARFSLENGVPEITDAAGADQATEFLRANLYSQPGTALAAQANANPESAYNLLI